MVFGTKALRCSVKGGTERGDGADGLATDQSRGQQWLL